MKCLIKITDQNNKAVFTGKVINLPFKKAWIKAKCLELFDDDDPCIIHESYAISKLSEQVLELFERKSQNHIELKHYARALDFVDIENLDACFMSLEVKK